MLKIVISKKAKYNYITHITFNGPGFIFTLKVFFAKETLSVIHFNNLCCSHAMNEQTHSN